jgi:hypothetical protein
VSQSTPPRHRNPRYGRFLLTGVVLGGLVAAIVAATAGDPGDYSRNQLFLYLLMAFGLIGGLLGGAVAVLLGGDFRRTQKAPDPGAGGKGPASP